MGEWQTIETAPKGKPLMVSDGEWFGGGARQLCGTNGQPSRDWHMAYGFFQRHDGRTPQPFEAPNTIRATHWTPLPSPPSAGGSDE